MAAPRRPRRPYGTNIPRVFRWCLDAVLRRSAERAAGRGDADGVAEPDDDNEAESDDVRERLEKLEAMEHGEVDWDDDDVYSLGWGQSWSSVDHLA